MITKKLILSLFTFSLVFAQSGDEIAKKMESVRTPKDMKSNSTLILTNAKGKTQNKTIRSLSADDNKKQIIWFLAPARDKGVAFLKLENESGDDEMKLWLPAFKKIRRIKSSQKGDSFMGSDMSYEDMTSRNIDEYSYSLDGEDVLDGNKCWKLVSIPKPEAESTYSKIISWVDQNLYISHKEEFYNLNGNLFKVKTTIYDEIEKYHIPIEIYMENVIKNHNTRLKLENIEVDNDLKNDIFVEKNLKRKPM